MANVFICGCSAFIGKALTESLLERGHEVTGLVRSEERAESVRSTGAKAVVGDIRKEESLEESVGEADFVLHLATTFFGASQKEIDTVEYGGTRNLIKLCLKHPVKCLVFSGTHLVYGDTGGGVASESTLVDPGHLSPHPRARLAVEKLLLEAHEKKGLPAIILRLSTVYGAEGRLIKGLVSMIRGETPFMFPGSGNATASFVHVADVAQAFVLALKKKPTGEIYNVTDDTPATWNQFLEAFAHSLDKRGPRHLPAAVALLYAKVLQMKDQLLGQPVTISPELIKVWLVSRQCSNEKIKQQLGFAPRFPSFREGLEEVLTHYSF